MSSVIEDLAALPRFLTVKEADVAILFWTVS